MKPFLKWWLIIVCISLGLVFFAIYGGINYVNESDFTKISFLIFALFVYCSVMVGRATYKKIDIIEFPRFCIGIMTKLGMAGTVIGFISMLSVCLKNVDVQNTQSMQIILSEMTTGMSTALVTTAAGLIFSLLLHIQIFNFDRGIK
jgi:hypothetical protein